ncbi:Metalloprotease [Trichoderma velutinum]
MFTWNHIAASIVATLALASTTMGNAFDSNNFRCISSPSDEFKELSKRFAQEAAVDRILGRRFAQEISVSVYVHIVASSKNEIDGYLSDEAIHNQLQVLNSDYQPADISFTLKAIDRTINATWANGTDLERMWYYVRNGSYNDVNLWFIPTFKTLGLCTVPAVGDDLDLALSQDGCTIRSDTIPGGNLSNYNLGKTLTHEIGHWFGLLHTFEGGCDGDGDYVDDTPAQASPSNGCPEGRDSCPDKPGLDPIHNFMDYSYDSCYKEFTPGQVDRMRRVWSAYREWAAQDP